MLVVASVGIGRADNAIAVALAGRPHHDGRLRIFREFALFVEDLLEKLEALQRPRFRPPELLDHFVDVACRRRSSVPAADDENALLKLMPIARTTRKQKSAGRCASGASSLSSPNETRSMVADG